MNKSKILVTGSTGKTGAPVVKQLLENDFNEEYIMKPKISEVTRWIL